MAQVAVARDGVGGHEYRQSAALIRQTYEQQLFSLPAFKAGHYGLRMYRQTMDPKYAAAVWCDLARVASRLNRFAAEVHTPGQIERYCRQRLARYARVGGERGQLRYAEVKDSPEYLFLGVDLIGSMGRAHEYGLRHQQDATLREVIRRYDFKRYATDHGMIRAWAAQLANQVYWLRQLGEQDVVGDFVDAFRQVYPDAADAELSDQQFANKLYGMTHLVLADSGYYQRQVDESGHQWIYDYFRTHIDVILSRAKEDVIAEVGICFLLAGLEGDPVVGKTRKAILSAVDAERGMIPSVAGSFDLKSGEHRNLLAIMLLDWRGVNAVPTIQRQPEMFGSLPYGLEALAADSQ